MQTVLLASSGAEVQIGEKWPFVILGERINPTGRKALAADMMLGNDEDCMRWLRYCRQLAREQAASGGSDSAPAGSARRPRPTS